MNSKLRKELEAMKSLQTGDSFSAKHVHTLANGLLEGEGEFKYIKYDPISFPHPQTIGDTADSISGLGYADESMIDTIFIMPNNGTESTATLMIVVDEKEPSTDPKTYQYVYVGDINDLPSDVLTEESIVDDLTSGGTDKPLSAEQGKVLKGITTSTSYTTCESLPSDVIKTVNIPGYLEYISGGSIKIKFSHANTASGPIKLRINNLTSKPLYFDGEVVSESNTWGDEEVVEVYYDGTKFNGTHVISGVASNGFYNLDNRHPLNDGNNYTIETAVATVAADRLINNKQKNGMVITFWDGKIWQTYRYMYSYNSSSPTADEDFANPKNWEDFDARPMYMTQPEYDNLVTKNPRKWYFITSEDNVIYRIYVGDLLLMESESGIIFPLTFPFMFSSDNN